MRHHLGCPYANKNVFSNRRNSPSSVSGSRSSGGRLFQIRGLAAGKLRSPKRVWVLGAIHVSTSAERRWRRYLSEEAKNQDAIVSQQGKMAPRRAYKLARPAYSPHNAVNAEPAASGGPSKLSDVIPSPCTRDQAGSSVLYGLQPPE